MITFASMLRATRCLQQGTDVGIVKLKPSTAFEPTRQHHGPVSNADQTAHCMTDGLHHPTHFAITPLRDRDAIPAVGALSTAIFNRPERSHAIVQANALQKALLLFVAQSTQHPDRVLTFQTKARMHQLVCQLARAGKQKEPFRVQVKPAYRLPFAVLQTR